MRKPLNCTAEFTLPSGLNQAMIDSASAGKFKVKVANGVIALSWTERKDRFDQTYLQLCRIVNNSEMAIFRFLRLIEEI
jgi:hypothetical protein